MNKKIYVTVICLISFMCLVFGGCQRANVDEVAEPEKHTIAYPENYDTTSEGGSSFEGKCDDPQTKYFVVNDYYNMKSEGSLHILNHFETYQQTTEYTCGSASSQMVVNWFDKDLAKQYDELTIAKMSDTDSTKGASPEGIKKFFDEIGWKTEISASTDGYFEDTIQFEQFVIEKIDAGIPIMVDWIDWSGHWQVIIGIDVCKEDTPEDDVLILADPYDVSDQWQDGFYVFGATRFFYMWSEGRCTGKQPEDIYVQPFVVATPE